MWAGGSALDCECENQLSFIEIVIFVLNSPRLAGARPYSVEVGPCDVCGGGDHDQLTSSLSEMYFFTGGTISRRESSRVHIVSRSGFVTYAGVGGGSCDQLTSLLSYI